MVAVNVVPIFCDIDPETFLIDPEKIESLITDRTKAIICVHFGGMPCDMERIKAIAAAHDLKIIEDCAHAHGSRYKGKRVGNWGDCGTFSFQASKVLNAGEGGMITCNDDNISISYLRSIRLWTPPRYLVLCPSCVRIKLSLR